MSINHAVLGILSSNPMTGYDLKKIMQESSFMPWSGNNNQIYKTLVELHEDGFVTHEVCHQESSPTKKIYTITAAGLTELKRWVLSEPELPEIKKTFLVQLAWASQLSSQELNELINRYEKAVKDFLLIEEVRRKKSILQSSHNERETVIWEQIHENIGSAYKHELDWINQLRQSLAQFDDKQTNQNTDCNSQYELPQGQPDEGSVQKMAYKRIQKNEKSYVMLEPTAKPLQTEQDGMDLFVLCEENGTNLLMLPEEVLSEDFLNLRTGVAGAILQKFSNYNIRAAAVLDSSRIQGRFKELLLECSKGQTFRVYADFEQAEAWLLDTH